MNRTYIVLNREQWLCKQLAHKENNRVKLSLSDLHLELIGVQCERP